MHIDEHDRTMRPTTPVMRPTQLPMGIVPHIVLYLTPIPALQWIRHNSHNNRHIHEPILHEIFGTGCLPTHIDMSRYKLWMIRPYWQQIPLLSDLARSRNHLHDTISRIHLTLLGIIYWVP